MNCFQQLQGRHLEMLEWFKVDKIHHTHNEDRSNPLFLGKYTPKEKVKDAVPLSIFLHLTNR